MLKRLLKSNEGLKDVIFKSGITYGLRMCSLFLSFGSMYFMTHNIGVDFFGIYSLALTIMQISALLFGLGMPVSFLSFTGGYTDENHCRGLLLKFTRITLLLALLPAVVYFFGADFIAVKLFKQPSLAPYISIIGLGVPALIIHELICYYFLSVKKTVSYGLYIFILPNLFYVIAMFVLYYAKVSEHLFFYALVGSYVLTVLSGMGYIFARGAKSLLPDLTVVAALKKAFPMMLGTMFLVLLNWTDMLLLGPAVSKAEMGVYNSAFRIGYFSLFFVSSSNAILGPKISEYYFSKNFGAMKKEVNRVTWLVIALTVPFCLVLIAAGKPILNFFGEGMEVGYLTLVLIICGGMFNALTGNVDLILNMTGNQRLSSYIFFGGFVLNVILNVILIPLYGIEGSAAASLLCNIAVNTAFVLVIKKRLGFYTFA